MIIQWKSEIVASPLTKNLSAKNEYSCKKQKSFETDFMHKSDVFNKPSYKVNFKGLKDLFINKSSVAKAESVVDNFNPQDIEKIMTPEEKALSKKVFNRNIRAGFSSLNGTFASYMMASGLLRRYCRDGEETTDVRVSLTKTSDKIGRVISELEEQLLEEKEKSKNAKTQLYKRAVDVFSDKPGITEERMTKTLDLLFPSEVDMEELEEILDSNRKLYEEFSEKTKDFHDSETILQLEAIDAVFDEIFPIYRQLKGNYATVLAKTRLN